MLIFWLHKNNVIVSEYVLNIRMVRLMDINYSGGVKLDTICCMKIVEYCYC